MAETINIIPNPTASALSASAETVRRPPASPEVSTLQPVKEVMRDAVERASREKGSEAREANVKEAIAQIQIMMDIRDRDVTFTTDQESGANVIRVIDRNSGDVIRQLPAEELLSFMRNLTRMLGTFLDERV
tara:strand:- start:388 stop:783 length:396 start_codon:yes stop_codon:yes gene_type:complete